MALAPRRITAISVSEDEDGYVTITSEDPTITSAEERVGTITKKMSNGTLGGRSKVATPLLPTTVAPAAVPTAGFAPPPEPPTYTYLPGIEFVGSATATGAGAVNLGSFTIGGDAPDTYYVVTIAGERAVISTTNPTISHLGGSVAQFGGGWPGSDPRNMSTWVITPGGSAQTAPVVLTPNTAGTNEWAAMVFRVKKAVAPGGWSFVGLSGLGGQSTGTSYSLSSSLLHTAGKGILLCEWSRTNTSGIAGLTATVTLSGDLAANQVAPQVTIPGANAAYLDASFTSATPHHVIDPPTPPTLSGSVAANLSGTLKGTFSMGWAIPGVP